MKTPTVASHPIGELYEKLQGQHSVQWFFEEVLSEDEAEKLKKQMRAKGLASDFMNFFDNRLPHVAKLYGEFKRMPIELAVVTLAKKRALITEEKRNFLLRKYELKQSEIEFILREAKERADLVVVAHRSLIIWKKEELEFRFANKPGKYFLKLAKAASRELTIGPEIFSNQLSLATSQTVRTSSRALKVFLSISGREYRCKISDIDCASTRRRSISRPRTAAVLYRAVR